jgi:bifunctional DNA-binding transcriptional regulator/antitoxin component of YhaV-PrlF toxin-antitoxin module
MSTVDVDDRGRIYVPKDVREDYGKKFRIVRLKDSIKLIPVDEDPVEGLKQAMKGLKDVPKEEIEKTVSEEAMKEIEDDLR